MVVIALVIIALLVLRALARRRPASCRSRTRAICWPPCSFRTAPRWRGPRRRSTRSPRSRRKTPGVDQVVTIAGISALDNSAPLANAGVAYIMLKDWSERGKRGPAPALHRRSTRRSSTIEEARVLVLPPPPIQGIGNAAGFTMQVELRDGSFDFAKLQSRHHAWSKQRRRRQASIQRVMAPRSAPAVPQFTRRGRPGEGARPLHVTVDQVFAALGGLSRLEPTSTSSTNSAAPSRSMCRPIRNSGCDWRTSRTSLSATSSGDMIPLGTLVDHHAGDRAVADQPLQSLSVGNASSACRRAASAPAQAMELMEQIAEQTLPPGTGYEWTAMSYQEKIVGGQMLHRLRVLALLLVYLVLAGQYESWYAPLSVILVGAAGAGRAGARCSRRSSIDNNLYVQIGLILLIALSAKNAILIVEVARELRQRRQGHRRSRRRGGACAVPADPDDLVRLHPRRRAAGARDRRRRQRAQVDRHHRVHRHARLDLPRRAVRAVVLRRDAALRGMARGAQTRGAEPRPPNSLVPSRHRADRA